jgi:hypothetical protein
MTRPTLALALLLSACVPANQRTCASVRTQADVGLIVGSGAIMIGTAAAVDPTGAVDSKRDRRVRTDIELAAAGVAIAGIVVAHAAAWDAQQCIESPEKNDAD